MFQCNEHVEMNRQWVYLCINKCPFQVHLKNKFDFGKVHGIMNTSGLLQSK